MKTAHHRTRKITDRQIGQLVFFWRADRSKARDSQSKWVGPGYVAGEHLREAIGDESMYGNPDVQKALALFRKVPV